MPVRPRPSALEPQSPRARLRERPRHRLRWAGSGRALTRHPPLVPRRHAAVPWASIPLPRHGEPEPLRPPARHDQHRPVAGTHEPPSGRNAGLRHPHKLARHAARERRSCFLHPLGIRENATRSLSEFMRGRPPGSTALCIDPIRCRLECGRTWDIARRRGWLTTLSETARKGAFSALAARLSRRVFGGAIGPSGGDRRLRIYKHVSR